MARVEELKNFKYLAITRPTTRRDRQASLI